MCSYLLFIALSKSYVSVLHDTSHIPGESMVNLDVKILFSTISHHLGPEIRKMLVMGMSGNKDSIFHSGL